MVKEVFHLHRRKRVCKKLEEYPSKNKRIRMLDKLVLLIAFVAPIFDLPQLFKIYTEKSATGVSFLSWFLFTFFAIPWFIYGIVHKEKPIIVAYFLWIIIDTTIVVGIILYS